ncbi:putative Major facilitator superfamily (MFS) profile domain-containing protein [Seiridium unicorne]|uniref:Major facilitator superfamily (MFS) profile domain-containing protein n=1 Tax=Seiridium unicorne TaxID=138068 RepID=A0ABR2V2X9_9PEZI
MMGLTSVFANSTIAKYVKSMRAAPREVITSRRMFLTAALYAMCGIPITWDQGSSSVVPSLPGFQEYFGISSGSNAKLISNYVSIVYIGCGVGACLSFFINDRIGRLWSLRLYMSVWIIGQLVATFAPNLAGLYASRIISGLGIGPLTVLGPMSIVEIAPTEMRGLLAAWFSVAMLMSLFVAVFCVYGVFTTMAVSRLQYQVVWFSPTVFLFLCIVASFFLSESPRWLALVDRHGEALKTLADLRGLPEDHPRVQAEMHEILASIGDEASGDKSQGHGFMAIVKETFLIPSNLRRVQQVLVSYALAQLSGANSVTSYLVPILTLMGLGGGTTRSLFLSGMYSMAKFFFTLMASFFFIDALGRRKSLLLGATIQMISDIYIGVYIKFKQQGGTTDGASQAAIAAIFFHGFGYAIGLLTLPYVFGAELWPNRIRSFGAALSQTFHWLFYYGVNAGTASLLAQTNNWGAFIFFAAWCMISLIYVYFLVPEIAGLSIEEIEILFRGSWFSAHRRVAKRSNTVVIEGSDSNELPLEASDSNECSKEKAKEGCDRV